MKINILPIIFLVFKFIIVNKIYSNDSLRLNYYKLILETRTPLYLYIVDTSNNPIVINKMHLYNLYRCEYKFNTVIEMNKKILLDIEHNKKFNNLKRCLLPQAYHQIDLYKDSLYLNIVDDCLIEMCFDSSNMLKNEYSKNKRIENYIVYKLLVKKYFIYNESETGIISYFEAKDKVEFKN